jgi:hypothetical protein
MASSLLINYLHNWYFEALAGFPQGFPVFGIIIVEREQLGEFRQLGRDFGGNQGMGLGKTRNV